MPVIPLFPLGSVLFPGAALPLHIFEPRYKLMIAGCIEREQPFGVVLIRDGSEVGSSAVPHEVGTTASITRVEHLSDGRLNIIAIGQQRFRILSLDHSQAHLAGEVRYLERAPPAEATGDLAAKVGELFSLHHRSMLALGGQWTRRVGLPTHPEMLANFVAARLDISAGAKQHLLEFESVDACLAAETHILEESTAALTRQVNIAHQQRYASFGKMN